MRGAGEAEHEVLAGTVPSKPLPGPPPTHPGQLPLPPTLTEAEAKRMRKAQKRAAKEARRAEKKVISFTTPVTSRCRLRRCAVL